MTPPTPPAPPPGPAEPGPLPPLTPAQRRAVTGADPGTGELRTGAATRRRLGELGLARAYGRLGAHYLTGRGRAVREELRRAARERAATTRVPAGFTPATGDGPGPGSGGGAAGHARAAVRAWEALLEIRRVTGTGSGADPGTVTDPGTGADPGTGSADPPAVPAQWERSRPVHAVALALEAAGVPASAVDTAGRRVRTGYRVGDGCEPGTVRVEWRYAAGAGPGTGAGGVPGDGSRTGATEDARRRLGECAGLLREAGWETEQYLGAGRRPFLLAAPRLAGTDAGGVRRAQC